jgi:uncharacterized membrane protein
VTPAAVVTVGVGGALTLAGAALLVVALRHGQSGRGTQERRAFRLSVAAIAVGSLLFLATIVLTG